MGATRPVTLVKGLLEWGRPNDGSLLLAATNMAFELGTLDFRGPTERNSLVKKFVAAKVDDRRHRCANRLIDEVVKHLHTLRF